MHVLSDCRGGIAFLYLGDSWDIQTKRLYLFAMNGLIGAKVLTGLSVLYYRMIEKYRGDSDGVLMQSRQRAC